MAMDPYEKKLLLEQPVDLHPLGNFEKPGQVRGLILPTGVKMMNMREVSEATLQLYSDYLNADKFTVTGTWTFVPDLETLAIDTFPRGVENERKKK